MLQSVSGLVLDYHLTQARQKREKKKNTMSNCHDGRVVYVSMTPALFLRCIQAVLITLHAVYSSNTFTNYVQT